MNTRREKSGVQSPKSKVQSAGTQDAGLRTNARAFTLIEIMVVASIMVLILAMGIPSIYQMTTKKGMRRAVSDVLETCAHARAQAILRGQQVDLVFHPLERRFEVAGSAPPTTENPDFVVSGTAPPAPIPGLNGVIPEDVTIEMLDINLLEYNQSEYARVKFYPNGTCDELTLVLRSDQGEWRKITLEVTTALATQGDVR
jgi:type II secretory pathway pseudopilin PulG